MACAIAADSCGAHAANNKRRYGALRAAAERAQGLGHDRLWRFDERDDEGFSHF